MRSSVQSLPSGSLPLDTSNHADDGAIAHKEDEGISEVDMIPTGHVRKSHTALAEDTSHATTKQASDGLNENTSKMETSSENASASISQSNLDSDFSLSDLGHIFKEEDIKIESSAISPPTPRTRRTYSIKSSYFPDDEDAKEEGKKKRVRRSGKVSANAFPPLDAERFGLIQEEFCHESFWVIIVTIFLTLTTGRKAVPVFRLVKERWPSPEDLMDADEVELFEMIKSLGLFKRLKQYKDTAKAWAETPPQPGQRHRVLHYPNRGDGKDIKPGEILSNDDSRTGAWEIGHIAKGAYALDSWRIFCRDIFLGKAKGWKGEGAPGEFEPEWKRVNPGDKELRAVIRWMWLKEGYYWDAETGERWIAGEDLMLAAAEGRIGWDKSSGDFRIVPVEEVMDGSFAPRVGGDVSDILAAWQELVNRKLIDSIVDQVEVEARNAVQLAD